MKINRLLVGFLFLFVLMTCKSPSERINDAFKTVNNSIDKSNEFLTISNNDAYLLIQSGRKKNAVLSDHADSLFAATQIASEFIDSLIEAIQFIDTLGTNSDLSGEIFINSTTGDKLKENLLVVYTHSYSSLIDKSKTLRLDSALNSIAELKTNDNWKTKYFQGTPTMAAVAILNRFKGDCISAANISLLDMKEHLQD